MYTTKILFNSFNNRHIGNINKKQMLKIVNSNNINNLVKESINNNNNFRLVNKIALNEDYALKNLKDIINKNKVLKTYIGSGYTNSILPNVIKRNVLENPKWYTAYTPYQAEISQGRLETQYNYQELIKSLTGLPISNASLLDEGSSATEVLNMSYNYYKQNKKIFYCSNDMHPQIINILKHRANILDIELIISDLNNIKLCDNTFGIMFQYPNTYGDININFDLINKARDKDILISCSADLLSLTKIKSPQEIGANISFGTAQQFGIPLWYGGPHPSYLSCDKKLLRMLPGRIISKSIDINNDEVYRLGLQTREQHIKKEKATSNICTAQSLLANVATFYSIYNGKNGIENIANEINNKAILLSNGLRDIGLKNINNNYFNTILFECDKGYILNNYLKNNNILVRNFDDKKLGITIDETTTYNDCIELLNHIDIIVSFNYEIYKKKFTIEDIERLSKFNINSIDDKYKRTTSFLDDKIFNKYTTETDFIRYIYNLTKKDYTLCEGMIPLGSCTMKLNSSTQLDPLSWDKIKNVHPYSPKEFTLGYQELIKETGDYLKDITGFPNVSFQTNSGAMGEYSGLLCIKKYHEKNKQDRNICLIPESAHGTNFASCNLANLKLIKFNDNLSNEDFEDLVKKYKDNLACLMITYPGTNGVFQKNINFICDTIHKYGGLVYMDGANMNAMVGLSSPSTIGADICHLNLHKTFCIPHGGGGPGMGPILCNDKLKDFLPDVFYDKKENSIGQITSAKHSSAALLVIPYMYIKTMGSEGLKQASEIAILNSNYLKDKLKDYYEITDVNEYGRVAHEFIIDIKQFKKYNISEQDIAKRLIDYSFHPGTMSWPRKSVIMFEPTESESQEELDRLVESLIKIREEIQEIIDGKYDKNNNVLKNSPHCLKMIKTWDFPYSFEKAFYPIKNLEDNKFFPSIGRVNDIEGDKRLLNIKIV